MFGSNYVKIRKDQWEEIKKEFKKLEKENIELKAELEHLKSLNPYELIKTQSKTIERLSKENEKLKELLEFYEKSFYELKDKISIKNQTIYDLENKLKEKEKEIAKLNGKINAISDLYNFVINKYVKNKKDKSCPEYEEVGIIDIKA
jgi:predicted RNase H-like nuclease (RuvC/YqgF family)